MLTANAATLNRQSEPVQDHRPARDLSVVTTLVITAPKTEMS